jgi:hypothetical protein
LVFRPGKFPPGGEAGLMFAMAIVSVVIAITIPLSIRIKRE